jgi:hypothetical protein
VKLICPSIVTFRCSPHSNAGMMGLSSFKLHGKLRPFHGGSYTIAHCTQCRLFLLGDTIHPTISFKLLIQHQMQRFSTKYTSINMHKPSYSGSGIRGRILATLPVISYISLARHALVLILHYMDLSRQHGLSRIRNTLILARVISIVVDGSISSSGSITRLAYRRTCRVPIFSSVGAPF